MGLSNCRANGLTSTNRWVWSLCLQLSTNSFIALRYWRVRVNPALTLLPCPSICIACLSHIAVHIYQTDGWHETSTAAWFWGYHSPEDSMWRSLHSFCLSLKKLCSLVRIFTRSAQRIFTQMSHHVFLVLLRTLSIIPNWTNNSQQFHF